MVTKAPQMGNVKDSRVLRSLTNAYSCEHRIILGPSAEPELALKVLARCLADESPAWHRVILAGLDPADETVGALAIALRRVGLAVQPFFDSGTWYQDTGGLSFESYLAGRPAVLRNTWRRKVTRLERLGTSQFKYYETAEELEKAISDYQEVYSHSWKPDENFPLFIPELIRLAARLGALRMGILHFDARPVAAQFWIVWRGRACIYKLAHDKGADEYSPGTVLTMRMMERVLAKDKPIEVNFGRGDDPYKKLWLPLRRERWGLAAANPRTLRGFGHAVRQAATRLVKPSRLENLTHLSSLNGSN
jgi:hypothetical protein